MGSRGQLLGVGWHGSAGGCWEAWRIVLPPTPPRRRAQKPARAGLAPRRRPVRGPAASTLAQVARRGRDVAAPPPSRGIPNPARLRPRTTRRPPRPRSGPTAHQPPLRARLSSTGLGLLFGRDASSERRLTRGGRAGASASTLSTRSDPLSPSQLRRKRRQRDLPHRRPPGSPGLHRWPRRRPRVPQFDKWTDSQRRRILTGLLERCSLSQQKFCCRKLQEKIPAEALDFTTKLPRVLSVYIFSFLDPRSLCRCAQTPPKDGFIVADVQPIPGSSQEEKQSPSLALRSSSSLRKKNNPGEKELPPWRSSDKHPTDIIRFNYLDNCDPEHFWPG
ncbi:F-box protein 16 [Cricetulus griseus]